MSKILREIDSALAAIEDGAMLAIPADYAGVAMEATRALIRRGVQRLHLVTLPASSLQADLLIGAGCVATVETSAIGFGELGAGAALHRRNHERRDPHQGRYLPGHPCGAARVRDGQSLRHAARSHRLRYLEVPRRLEGDRQSLRHRRSDRAAAGAPARRGALPCAVGRPPRQCLGRPPPRSLHPRPCLEAQRRHRREAA